MLLSLLPADHELDRLPDGSHSVPLSTLEGVRAVPWGEGPEGAAPAVWLHGHAPGRYEMVEGEERLAAARRAGSPSVPLRLTRRRGGPRAAPSPEADPVALCAPPAPLPGRLRPGPPAPATAAEVAARLLAPAQPGLARAAGLAAGVEVEVTRGQFRARSAAEARLVARALDLALDAALGAAALDAAVRGGAVPGGWRDLGWLRKSDRRAPRPAPPSPGAVVWAAAAEPAVRFALGQLRRAAAALAPWGARVGAERALLVAPREHLEEVSAYGVAALDQAGGGALAAAREALERALGGSPGARSRAALVAAPLERDPLAWEVAFTGALWDEAAASGARVPGDARRFADLPHPTRALAAVLAAGLTPVMLDGRGAVLGVPAAVTHAAAPGAAGPG